MRKQLVILLVVLALLVVPVAAEEKNWSYTIDSNFSYAGGITFGCNLNATDYSDFNYDRTAPPPPPFPAPTNYAFLRVNKSAVDDNVSSYITALNAPLSLSNDETVFTLQLKPDDTNQETLKKPFTITWDPVADADYLSTITSITLVNLSDTSDYYNMMTTGNATGTAYIEFGGKVYPEIRDYSITVTYHLDPPVTNFSADKVNVVAGETVTFTDKSTGFVDSYLWEFGDGAKSELENPTHAYANAGSYPVNLTATNEAGSVFELKPGYITVTSDAPIASFDTNVTSGDWPLTVMFTDTSVAVPGKAIVGWSWNFSDGPLVTTQHPIHTFAKPGSYDVILTVTDNGTKTGISAPKTISVAGPAPVANFSGAPTLVSVMNGLVQFTDRSTSANFTVKTWNWVFGDDGISTDQDPAHTYKTPGTYTVNLTVGDDQVPAKTNTTTKAAYIKVAAAPTAEFNWTDFPDVAEGFANVTVTFTDESTVDPLTSLSTWAWDFGLAGNSTDQAPGAINFSAPGWYDISLNVTDNLGGYDVETKQRLVHVKNTTPVANFTATPIKGDAPLTVTFNGSISTGIIDTYAWDFGNGKTLTSTSPVQEYTYKNVGVWDATLTVTNDGGSDTFGPVAINVTQPPIPIPDFTANTVSGRSPLTVQFNEAITGNWTSVLWEFEDSGTVFTSTEADPEFTFHLIGGHTVSLTAYNAVGSMTETKVDYIRVSLPLSDNDDSYLSTPDVTPATPVPTSRPGEVTPVATAMPTKEPTQVVTPVVTPVPTTTTATPIPTTTPGFGIIVAVLGCVAALVVIRR